jgi:hypothetical protein
MVGEFLLQKLSSLPSYSSDKVGRMLYNEEDGYIYINAENR